MQQMQTLESTATQAVDGLMAGNGTDIHTAMIATQKADLAFEMALAFRNKAVSAYQQLMSTQF
jgi:flagellar hook-basal body complex protein FliE